MIALLRKKNFVFYFLAMVILFPITVFAESIDYVSSTLWTGVNEVKIANGHAYCNFDNGLIILNLADPSTPVLKSQMLLGGNNRKFFISGNYLYVANDLYGLQVIDVSNPENPNLIENHNTENEAVGIYVFADYAFITTAWIDEVSGDDYCEILIFDVSNPLNIEQVGQFSAWFHLPVTDIFATENHIFTTYGGNRLIEGYDILFGGLAVFDSDDYSDPSLIADYQTNEIGFNSVSANDNHVFVSNSSSGLQIFNIQYLPSLFLESEFSTPGIAQDISVVENYVFVADGGEGIQIIDISDTQLPELVANYQDGFYINSFDVHSEYAYTSSNTNIRIIDTSIPSDAFLAGIYNTPYIVRHTSISGNIAGISLDNSGFQLLDISDPYNPIELGHTNISERIYASFLENDYAYVVDFTSGFLIFNIMNPENPELTGSLELSGETHDLVISGNYAFLASGLGGLRILDISDLENPELIGNITFQGYATGVHVTDDYAYVTSDAFGLRIINISDPENPELISTVNTPSKASQVCTSGDYAYVADGYNGDLQIINVSNPEAPEITSSFNMQGNNVYDVFILGEYIFVAADNLWAIDISDPENPVYVDHYITPANAKNTFVVDNYIYVADQSSLIILYLDQVSGKINKIPVSPEQFSISQNFPNPFNSSTTINFNLSAKQNVKISIFDFSGNLIKTLIDGESHKGDHLIVWNGINEVGNIAPPGIYFYLIELENGYHAVKRMLLID